MIDGLGRRIGKKRGGVLEQGWLYADGLRIVAELDGSGAVTSRFVYGEGINVPEAMVRGGVTYKLVTDHLGSVRMVVDVATGAVAQHTDYDAWGRITSETLQPGFEAVPFGFAGGLYDRDTQLVRFGARDYDPRVGRWTSKDPIRFEGGSASLFEYVSSDPVNHRDPHGEIAAPIVVGAIAIASIAGASTVGVVETAIAAARALGGSSPELEADARTGTAAALRVGGAAFGAGLAGAFAAPVMCRAVAARPGDAIDFALGVATPPAAPTSSPAATAGTIVGGLLGGS